MIISLNNTAWPHNRQQGAGSAVLDGVAGRAARRLLAGAQPWTATHRPGAPPPAPLHRPAQAGSRSTTGSPGATFSGISRPWLGALSRAGSQQHCRARTGGVAPGGTGGGRDDATASLILQVKAPLGPRTTPPSGGQGGESNLQVVRPWRAPCPAVGGGVVCRDPWADSRARDRAEHKAIRRWQGAWSAVLSHKLLAQRYEGRGAPGDSPSGVGSCAGLSVSVF